MPVFNAEKYLSAAIESVLAQDYRPIQLIVSDDGSTDNSAAIARGFAEVEYRFQQHAGASAALNHGIEAAQGSFIAFLDADRQLPLWNPRQPAPPTTALKLERRAGGIVFSPTGAQLAINFADGIKIFNVSPTDRKDGMSR